MAIFAHEHGDDRRAMRSFALTSLPAWDRRVDVDLDRADWIDLTDYAVIAAQQTGAFSKRGL